MKKLSLLCAVAIIALTFASCRECNHENPLDKNGVRFSGTVENVATRLSGTTWSTGDAIGVFAITAGTSLAEGNLLGGVTGANNRRFTTIGNGEFLPAPGQAIVFPPTGDIDFIAYHPHSTAVTATFTLPINVTTQNTVATQTALDILYSNNATGYSNANHNVTLNFQRQMSKLVLNVTAGDGVPSLEGLQVEINGLIVDASMNLANGVVTLGTTTNTINPLTAIASGNQTATATAILPPQAFGTAIVRFLLNGDVFEWDTPPAINLERRTRYTFNFQLSTTGLEQLKPGTGSIEDWLPGPGNGGDIVLTPDDEFDVSKDFVTLGQASGTSDAVNLVSDQDWEIVVTSVPAWLTVSPMNGTAGDTPITFTTTSANADVARTAIVVIEGDNGEEIEVTVVQQGPLMFAGSNFNIWSEFIGGLLTTTPGTNAQGLHSFVLESPTGAEDGSGALHVLGSPASGSGTAQLFSAILAENAFAGRTSISFDINGTASRAPGITFTNGTGTSVGTITHSVNLDVGTTNPTPLTLQTGTANFAGSINTGGNWVRVTVDLGAFDLSAVTRFQIRVGAPTVAVPVVDYNFLIDNITIQ